MHFEDLWEKCEEFHKNSSTDANQIIDEMELKLAVYKRLISKLDPNDTEGGKAKSHLLGEILLSFTNLSLKENINVFEALNMALHQRKLLNR